MGEQDQGYKLISHIGSLFDLLDVRVKWYEIEDNHGIKKHCRDISHGGYSTAAYQNALSLATPNTYYWLLGDSDKKN